MSHPSRPRTRGPAERRPRSFRVEQIIQLEDRKLMTPVVTGAPPVATFTAAATQPPNTTTGTVTVTFSNAGGVNADGSAFESAAPLTSVSELTPITSFGGDIVRIEAGPGGSFGEGVYAISRGAGGNTGAINRPGVIYRVDPATGKSTVFFDLNSVINQLEPGNTAAASAGAASGLVNWYDISFDPNGVFNGTPSMFVSSVDRSDPAKNAIYQIGAPTASSSPSLPSSPTGSRALKFSSNPSAILVPPTEQQSFQRRALRGQRHGGELAGQHELLGLLLQRHPVPARPEHQHADAPLRHLRDQLLPRAADLAHRGQRRLHLARLRHLHRLRHPRRGRHPRRARPERRRGLERRAPDQ